MLLPVRREARGTHRLERRQDNGNVVVVIGIIAASILAILAITFLLTRKFRKARQPSTSSNDKLPSLFSWKNFRKRPRRNDYETSLQDTEYRGNGGDNSIRESREMSGAASHDPERSDQQNSSRNPTGGVDRNTSVRSVMTLPPYQYAPRETERVLGREGERAGMDNVLELPETLDEAERQREEEMESLYQIRLARRVEAADREARRQARREARSRGDVQALADIRRRAEEAADLSVSQLLIAEHQSNARNRERDRRVSSVAYGDLGVARHDGTRVRANSSESDRRPLLDSAASISGQSARSRMTGNTLDPETHARGLSITSIDSRASSDFGFTDAVRTNSSQSRQSHNGGTSDEYEVVSLHPERSNSGSRSGSVVEIPNDEAPAYEDPPNYESPVNTRAPQLPGIERLPSIRVISDQPASGDLGTRR